MSRLILVVGGTGAQGFAVVKALLESNENFTIRVMSRQPDAKSVQEAFKNYPQVELVQGSFMDFDSVTRALQGCYGAFINTSGFVASERDELWASIRIFEIANTIPTMRHFVYSSLDYFLQMTNFNHKYAVHHANAKGRFHTYLQGMASPAHPSSKLSWSVLQTVGYNENLMGGPCVPQIDADGTRVFKFPLGEGRMPWITLSDVGAFALKIFQDREYWSGKFLNGVSHFVTGTEMAETLSRVAGVSARYEPVSYDEWVLQLPFRDFPVAQDDPDGIKHKDNFRMWWPCWEDGLVEDYRSVAELKAIHPGLQSFEDWVRETGWDGTAKPFMKQLMDAGLTAEIYQPRA